MAGARQTAGSVTIADLLGECIFSFDVGFVAAFQTCTVTCTSTSTDTAVVQVEVQVKVYL